MTTTTPHSLETLPEAEYKKRIKAWIMYDWANSAFSTTILAAVLPVYYSAVAGANLPSEAKATEYWAIGLSLSVAIIAIISPILGTISDIQRGKKKFLGFFVGLGVLGTGLLVLVSTGDWLMASIFFVIARIGNGAANVFYDALLPHVARDEDQDKVSTQGFAMGYLGGGLLLAVNVAMIQFLPGTWGPRLSFLTVAVWWAIFSVPIFRNVPEPRSAARALAPGESLIRVAFARLIKTFKEIRQYRELFKYLVAFLIYNDGIGTIIGIAAIYGAELGFGTTELILALLLVQFVGIPFSLIFGSLPSQENKRRVQYLAFVIFNIVMLPTMGILARFALDQEITGTPSAPFTDTTTAVGEGAYSIEKTELSATGAWQKREIPALERGLDPDTDTARTYAFSDDSTSAYALSFNGQQVALTYLVGPEHGIWAVEVDGAPLLDGSGDPLLIDAYNDTIRYDETIRFQTEKEGEHQLILRNSGTKNPDSSGTLLALAQVDVLPPLRTSNLGMIIGLLFGLQLVGALFALLLGKPLFTRFAALIDTKQSIMIAVFAYGLIAVWGFFLNSVVEYWFLAWMVAIVQGGSQALSRSLYASLSPPSMSGEFFGLFSIMSKFASVLSPWAFVYSVRWFNSSRPGILSVVFFFILGGFLLSRVNVAKGKKLAQEKEAELQQSMA